MNFCSELNNVLTFLPKEIKSCCIVGNAGPIYFDNFDKDIKKLDFSLFKIKKKEFFQNLEGNNSQSLQCLNCIYNKPQKKEDIYSEQFSLLYLNNWTHCNCGCFYCDRLLFSKGEITTRKMRSEFYDMLPIIKELYKHNLLDKNRLKVIFHGGDLSVLKEFESIVKLLLKEGVKEIDFSSNNIIFQPLILKCIKNGIGSLNMSLDSGTKETYKKIKRVDKFDDVINNLTKYVEESGPFKQKIGVKYILLKGINDNKEEIKEFIYLMKEIGIRNVSIHLEHSYTTKLLTNKQDLPAHFKELIEYFIFLCKKYNFYFDTPNAEMNYVMTKGC